MEIAFKPTTHGRAILSACMSHTLPLQLTRVAFGSGRVSENRNLADMHELIQYVADGTIGDRRHEDDRLYLTVQYANDAAHASVSTFMLSEFMIYARDPETGEDRDFIYATLGDYSQAIPAYRAGFSPGTWSLPLVIIISDEIEVSISAPAGLVTHDELIRLLSKHASGAAKRSLTIPTGGWTADADTGGTYPLHLDIASAEITEDMVPLASILPQSLPAAIACGLCPACRTLPGLLRFYTKSAPASDIQISLALLDTVPQGSNLASSAAAGRLDIEIPVEGWTDSGEGAYPYSTEIRHGLIDASMIPLVTILPEFLEVAVSSGMSPIAETLSGALRVYAREIPEAPIRASLALLNVASGITGSIKPDTGSGYVLPTATEYALGGVKVQRGSGLTVDEDGNLCLDTAPKEAVVNLFKGSNG